MTAELAAVRGDMLVSPQDRRKPIAHGNSDLQVLHPTRKVVRPDTASFRRGDLMATMLPQAVGILLNDGTAHRVEEKDNRQIVSIDGETHTLAEFDHISPDGNTGYHLNGLAPRIIAAKIIPVSPWGPYGEPDDMILNFNPEWQTFHRSPDWVIDVQLDQRANTLQALFDRGAEAVRTGRITSPASWRPE